MKEFKIERMPVLGILFYKVLKYVLGKGKGRGSDNSVSQWTFVFPTFPLILVPLLPFVLFLMYYKNICRIHQLKHKVIVFFYKKVKDWTCGTNVIKINK